MTPDDALREASEGKLRPVYLVLGEERYLVAEVVSKLRQAALGAGPAGFNDDRFVAGDVDVEKAIGAAQTMPMMARRRVVTIGSVERWEPRGGGDEGSSAALDRLAEYARDPSPSTVLLLVASKLHGQRRVVTLAKKEGFLVSCPTLARRELPSWIHARARALGHALAGGVAETLAEMVGPDLGPVADALERLSLYVGPKAEITEQAVAHLVTRVRQENVWKLVDELADRRLGAALAALDDAHEGRDAGPKLLGAVAWSVRQLVKYAVARRAGQPPPEAARTANVPPFKVQQVERAAKALGVVRLEAWLGALARADRELKGSRRSGQAVLEALLVELCR